MKENEEIFPLVDEAGNGIGTASRSYCHSGSKVLHPVVHLHVFDATGMLYLQRRSWSKDIQPGKWDTAVGGHMNPGETVEEALYREAREELGIEGFEAELVLRYIFESEIERELVYAFKTLYTGPIRPDESELETGRFWSIDEIREALGTGMLTPNFEQEFRRLEEAGAFPVRPGISPLPIF